MNLSSKSRYAPLILLVASFVISACQELPSVANEELAADEVVFSKKDCSVDPLPRGCKSDDNNSEGEASPAMYADYQMSTSGLYSNEIIVTNAPGTNHSGGRMGTGWATAFGVVWDGADFVFTDHKAAAPVNCPVGGTIGLLEANMKAGQVTTVWLRGNAADGTSWSSDKISVGTQTPDNSGWTLEVRNEIDLNIGKGQRQQLVCTVYVHDIQFSRVDGV